MDDSWPAIARFAEFVCGTLGSAQVQQRALPEVARLTRSEAGAVYLLDRHNRRTLASSIGEPPTLVYEFDELRDPCEYLRRAMSTQYSVHDAMIHRTADDHHRSPVGQVLTRNGFEHCLAVPLIRNGRTFGMITLSRRSGRPAFGAPEQQVADKMARFVSVALANATVYEAAAGPAGFQETVAQKTASSVVEVRTTRLSENVSVALQTQERSKKPGLEASLTAREAEVLDLVSRGLANLEIAAELGIALNTVKQHLKHVYHKLGARSRLDAMRTTERLAQTG
ncbi:LuxR C-terminal-related transcriptional regulator [Amycolatopsis rhabdoformis]|uniref:LuxR C-terminal-related transcriptional regulator n=1 Tax=Amycolatopsis rhabdoformis TaxID=1448059 RepID=A0ABZ1HV34_9PSEU|nr:LuxR C-terminal-related transcriptional regulator [Amycolatopsis rhabdoformis]WSE26197.1 LuxR C-terminal-related transcriptional regulator [Amycolatopsis rhabdoformis]